MMRFDDFFVVALLFHSRSFTFCPPCHAFDPLLDGKIKTAATPSQKAPTPATAIGAGTDAAGTSVPAAASSGRIDRDEGRERDDPYPDDGKPTPHRKRRINRTAVAQQGATSTGVTSTAVASDGTMERSTGTGTGAVDINATSSASGTIAPNSGIVSESKRKVLSSQDPDLTRKVIEGIGPENSLYHVQPIYYERDDHLDGWTFPDFATIHRKLYGVSHKEKHVVVEYSNPYNMSPTFGKFPHSNLQPDFFISKILDRLHPREPKFIVEVGSFQGHSAVLMGSILDAIGLAEVPILCIDPWTGDLNTWANKDHDVEVQHWMSPVRDGRFLLFDHFMTNVQFKISRHLSPLHILPFHATSMVGGRFLKAMKWHPDVIFLDSSHEAHETLLELKLYYEVLAPGGILFGDDFSWPGVKNDVLTFVAEMGWGRDPERIFDFEILPATTSSGGSVLLWLIHKAKYV
ncbi:unnamed protein product [Amoebophrya sp. A120]|nr:unnamed protein product [Amoebophrya sp. A120]|eukprot:GSA120T00001413001.1